MHSILPMLANSSNRGYFYAGGLCFVTAVVVAAFILATGCSPQLQAVLDTAGPILDGGWRVYNGQSPHVDFFAPIGAAYCWIIGAGMCLVGPSADAMAAAVLLLLPGVAWWAWIVARRRFSAGMAFFFTLFVISLLTATRPLGFNDVPHYYSDSHALSYAMQYNRVGWVCMCLLVVQFSVLPRDSTHHIRDAIGDLVGGSLGGVLVFVKITYGIAAVGLVIFLAVVREGEWRRLPLRVLGLIVAVLLCLWGIGSPCAFLADQAMIASAATPWSRFHDMLIICRFNLWPLISLLVCAMLFTGLLDIQACDRIRKQWRWGLISAVFVASLGVFLCASNAQGDEIPLITIAFLVLAEQCRRFVSDGHSLHNPHSLYCWSAISVVGLTMFWAPISLNDFTSVAYSWYWKHTRANSSQAVVINAPSLTTMWTDYRTGSVWVPSVNEAIDLLRKHELAGARVMPMTMFNPFPFALRLPSPKGGATCFHYQRLMGDAYYLPPERVFGDVVYVLILNGSPVGETDVWMEKVYGNYVKQHFHPVDESHSWKLCVRNDRLSE